MFENINIIAPHDFLLPPTLLLNPAAGETGLPGHWGRLQAFPWWAVPEQGGLMHRRCRVLVAGLRVSLQVLEQVLHADHREKPASSSEERSMCVCLCTVMFQGIAWSWGERMSYVLPGVVGSSVGAMTTYRNNQNMENISQLDRTVQWSRKYEQWKVVQSINWFSLHVVILLSLRTLQSYNL